MHAHTQTHTHAEACTHTYTLTHAHKDTHTLKILRAVTMYTLASVIQFVLALDRASSSAVGAVYAYVDHDLVYLLQIGADALACSCCFVGLTTCTLMQLIQSAKCM